MNASVITIHFGINYGSALQSYAMINILKGMGLSAEVIDYIPERYSFRVKYFEKKGIKGTLKCFAAFPFRCRYQHVFTHFLKKYVPMTRRFTNPSDLHTFCSSYDAYIAGSDQIWNSDYNGCVDPVYYLDFAPDKAKKVAYAASFGKSELEEYEIEDTKKLLKKFNAISVREVHAKAIVNKLGYEAVHVLDPTMLLDKSVWEANFPLQKKRESYVLVYALNHEEKELIRFARIIADKYQLTVKLISFSYFREKYQGLDECLTYQSPDEFVRLMMSADWIVTNSFHGVAFSINLNKQFIAVKRKLYNSRLESILQTVGLSSRIIENELPTELIEKEIDYTACNEILNDLRMKSISFLRETLR